MDNIDKRIELLHKVQEEQRRRERIQEEEKVMMPFPNNSILSDGKIK